MAVSSRAVARRIVLPPLHEGQAAAYWALARNRYKALRCGRRFGKADGSAGRAVR